MPPFSICVVYRRGLAIYLVLHVNIENQTNLICFTFRAIKNSALVYMSACLHVPNLLLL